MELWNEVITEKSQKVLFELNKIAKFVLIGGWACWLYAKTMKSKDIDIYINFDDFFSLQKFFVDGGISVNFNQKLNKYEAKLEEIDIDIYTPHHCPMAISCKDIFNKKLYKTTGGFKVVIPEALLLLKLDAERHRYNTINGFKDRIDILSLLHKLKFDKKLLSELAKEYDIDLRRIKEIVTKSNKEYSYFLPEAKNFSLLKKFKIELLRRI